MIIDYEIKNLFQFKLKVWIDLVDWGITKVMHVILLEAYHTLPFLL
jgi:hypothetical protein